MSRLRQVTRRMMVDLITSNLGMIRGLGLDFLKGKYGYFRFQTFTLVMGEKGDVR